MEKIKVLHVFGKMDRGGAETLIMNIFRNIDRGKFQFDFLVSSNEEGDYDKEIKKLGGNIYYAEVPKNLLQIPKYIRRVKKIMIIENHDVVHSHVYLFSGLITKIAKKSNVKKVISHSHTIGNLTKPSITRSLYSKYMKQEIKKNSDYLLTCSREAAEHLYETLDDSRIRYINNGIDLRRFNNIKISRKDFLKKISIPNDAFVVGHIGRFEEPKNHKFLISVFNEILVKRPNSYLLLVGRGKLKNEIKEQVINLGIKKNVLFLGVRDDIPEIVNSLDVFLFPSLYEGLGLVLIEAQALGVPCFVSDTVPFVADIGVGLFTPINLNKGKCFWANRILQHEKIRDEAFISQVAKRGYNIKDTVNKIESIYQ